MLIITRATLSLAANAMISAHDTIPRQACSNRHFAYQMISKPRKLLFGMASISAWFHGYDMSMTEASHPYNHSCTVYIKMILGWWTYIYIPVSYVFCKW
jgi:hypothetical protein